jgi:hypothetical protein
MQNGLVVQTGAKPEEECKLLMLLRNKLSAMLGEEAHSTGLVCATFGEAEIANLRILHKRLLALLDLRTVPRDKKSLPSPLTDEFQHYEYDQRLIDVVNGKPEDEYFAAAYLDELINTTCGLYEVLGDGNCQFRAIAHFVKGHEDEHHIVRLEVCSWMESNKELYAPFYTHSNGFIHSKETCERDGTWGDYTTLKAAALLYDLCILLRIKSNFNSFQYIIFNRAGSIIAIINFKQEVHYDCIVPAGVQAALQPLQAGGSHPVRVQHRRSVQGSALRH